MEYGAFVAGLDAGVVCNTFPTMFGYWIPPQAFDFAGQGLDDVVNNPLTVQFLHRALGVVVGLAAWGLWWWGRNYGLSDRQRRYLRLLPALTALQIVLGVITLLRFVPVGLATWHQLNGVLLLLAAVGLLQALTAPRPALTPSLAPETGSPPAAPAPAAR
jgi:cytochrome c oxidase assembly protein subunit 15